MAKSSISIGIDDATGQPDSAPEGPYITDTDDGSRPRKPRRRRGEPSREGARAGDADRRQGDLASRRKGPAQP